MFSCFCVCLLVTLTLNKAEVKTVTHVHVSLESPGWTNVGILILKLELHVKGAHSNNKMVPVPSDNSFIRVFHQNQ